MFLLKECNLGLPLGSGVSTPGDTLDLNGYSPEHPALGPGNLAAPFPPEVV